MRVGEVFISYARDDDQRTSGMPLSKGFVTALHELIAQNLNKLGPPKPTLFRDTEQIGQATSRIAPRSGARRRESARPGVVPELAEQRVV